MQPAGGGLSRAVLFETFAGKYLRCFMTMSSRVIPIFILLLQCLLAPQVARAEPYPLDYFALREVVSNAQVSPDGKHVAMLRILSREGNPILHVYKSDKLDGEAFKVNADPMEIRGFDWVSDSHIVMVLRQKVREIIDGQNEGVYESRIAILDVDDEKFDTFDMPSPVVENLLPNEPNKVIISMQPGMEDDLGLAEAFRPRAYYKVDLERGTRELLIRGKIDLGQISFDKEGDPREARGFDRGRQEYVWYTRDKGKSDWQEIFRLHEGKFDDFTIYGDDEAVPKNKLVGYQNGKDTRALWSFNTATKQFDELIYHRTDVDIYGVSYHHNQWQHPDRITAVTWFKDKLHREFFDEVEGAMYKQLEELIPYSHYISVTSTSRDGKQMVVSNQGPQDPGTYYFYNNGEFKLLGSQQPLLDSKKLAPVDYITYEARDGRKIPAFVTKPHGEAPFPLVVLPHGGPFVQEVIIYDEWAQMLANNGYMVVQPQYRGSKGYGKEHYLAAWKNGSEAGYAMQDDKDDAALYLVEQGLADKERLAMFGWSYGGYAALIAASREPQIYQCVIAGAAVADMVKQVNTIANESWFRGAAEIEQMAYRKGAVNPVDEAKKVNVPMLIVHGSVDQRVQPAQARLYMSQLDRYGKDYKYLELDGADHFYDTLFYEHQSSLYNGIIDFLQNDCGPEGL